MQHSLLDLQVNSPAAVLMNNNTSVIIQSKLGSLWHLQRLQAFMVQVQCASIYSQIVSRHERKLAFYIHFTHTDKDLQEVLDTLLITSDESIGPCIVIMLMIQIMFTVHAWVQLLNGPLRIADKVTGSLAPGTGTACPMNHYHFHPKQTLMQ